MSIRLRPQNQRILFGLKLRQLRLERDLSFQQLAKLTGMSVSYLNEIEKGKKSPKTEKLQELARALDVQLDELTDPTLEAAMMPVVDLLRSNFLNELPLERFGIELTKVVEIIASAPARVGAFITSLLELSRNYALLDENFYKGALRSWLEMQENYLEDSEAFAKTLRRQLDWDPAYVPTAEDLAQILRRRYDYRIVPGGLDEEAAFTGLERVYIHTDRSLLLAGSLGQRELRYHLAEEIGYQEMSLTERSDVAPLVRVPSFNIALAHASARAFAGALLLPTQQVDSELRDFFSANEVALDVFERFVDKYKVSPTVLFDRVAALLPRFLKIRSLYFIELTESKAGEITITRELHLGARHRPHATGLLEHYCRRWVGSRLLLRKRPGVQTGVQLSQFAGQDEEYIVIALADTSHDGLRRSVFLGTPLTPELEGRIPSLLKGNVPRRVVNNTCERCAITDCAERAAPPTVVAMRQQQQAIRQAVEERHRRARQAARRGRI